MEGYLCPMCETNTIYSTDVAVDCCIDCLNTGRRFEFYLTNPVRSNMLSRIREMEHVNTANLWRVSAANWILGIVLDDGRLLTAGAANEDDEVVFPGIPPVDSGWGIAMLAPEQEIIETVGTGYGDEEVVEKIKELAEV